MQKAETNRELSFKHNSQGISHYLQPHAATGMYGHALRYPWVYSQEGKAAKSIVVLIYYAYSIKDILLQNKNLGL